MINAMPNVNGPILFVASFFSLERSIGFWTSSECRVPLALIQGSLGQGLLSSDSSQNSHMLYHILYFLDYISPLSARPQFCSLDVPMSFVLRTPILVFQCHSLPTSK